MGQLSNGYFSNFFFYSTDFHGAVYIPICGWLRRVDVLSGRTGQPFAEFQSGFPDEFVVVNVLVGGTYDKEIRTS